MTLHRSAVLRSTATYPGLSTTQHLEEAEPEVTESDLPVLFASPLPGSRVPGNQGQAKLDLVPLAELDQGLTEMDQILDFDLSC